MAIRMIAGEAPRGNRRRRFAEGIEDAIDRQRNFRRCPAADATQAIDLTA